MSTTDESKDIVDTLRALYSQFLDIVIEEVDPDLSFVALGGDSFRAVLLFQKCLEKRLKIHYHAILSKSLTENAALAFQTQETLDSVDSTSGSKHEVFQLMSKDYDFGNIDEYLRRRHGLSIGDMEDIYPCSLMQENMYIGQKMGASSLYQTTSFYQVSTSYTFDQIKSAWQQVVDRHQTLRTIYVETSDSRSGRLLDAVVFAKMAGNVVAGTSDERDAILAGGPASNLKVGRGTYHQVTVFPEAGPQVNKRLLKIDLNHITVDATSMIVVIEELGQALKGLLSLKSPPTGYGRYIEYLQLHTDENRALDYWIEYLDDVRPCQFPALNESRKNQAGSSELIEVPVTITLPQLRQFCHNSRVTVATAIQAAWAQLLHVYTNEADVCFGYLCSGRGLPIPGVAHIVGPMMNLMVCCIRDIGNKHLQELVDTIRDNFNTALPNQCFSLRNVQRILGNSESKLFNTIVNTFYGPSKLIDDSDQIIKLVSSHNASDLDIVVKALYTDDELKIRLAYSSTTLSAGMARHVAHTFGSILNRMATVAEGPLCKVSNMVAASPYDIENITSWNAQATKSEDIEPASVHGLVQLTARKHPTRPAIHAWDGHMDYETFDKASSTLAQLISRTSIGNKKYISLCFEKSKWYSVALLAVMKSGNAFVPLDLSNPDQRMRKITDQLGRSNQEASLIICSRKLAERCASLAQHTIVLDQGLLQVLRSSDSIDTDLPTTNPSDPAYVIFTSGSTGEPKGVIIEHGAYSHAAQTHASNLHISHESRVLQFASYGFDTSMEDHLTTFILGGCLCVPSEEDRLSIPGLAAFALQSEANWVHITPSFAETLNRREFPSIKTLVLGGEPMTFGNIREWAKPGECRLIQVYGPSECCVTTTVNSDVNNESVPTDIGSALPGCATWVTRPEEPHELCPVGAVGELLVEGPILARGYMDNPEQTSASFVRDLQWAPGRRMYRTGDLVKYDSKGRLHFVGRRDGQVKLHGQRIELGEIERQLLLDPQVQNALALAPKSGPCANKLVAVVSPTSSASSVDTTGTKPGAQPSAFNLVDGSWYNLISDTRTFLEERLPVYMVPELWIVLREIPRNSSAKLDRKEVMRYLEHLSPDEYNSMLNRTEEQSTERSGTAIEEKIRDLWAEVLNIPADEILWTSSFFSLGGDSISAMTVASLAFQQGLSFLGADILRYRNIQRLSKALTLSSHVSSLPAARAVEEEMRDVGFDGSTFPLSPIQRLHFQTSDGMGDPFDQQTIVLRVRSPIDEDALVSAFEALLVAHPMLRARFLKSQEESCLQDPWYQCIAPAAEARTSSGVRLRFHSWARDGYVVDSIAEARSAINIAKGPLVAADLFRGKDRLLLSVTIHHLVIDTVSWRILLQELERHLQGETIVAHETTSFKAWSLAQRHFASSSNPCSAIPPMSPGPSRSFWEVDQARNTFEATETHKIKLDRQIVKHLQAICESTRCELIDVLSFVIVSSFFEIFRRSPQLFLEGHGREPFSPALDPSNTIGWFTTFSPLHLSCLEVGSGDLIRGLIKVRNSRKSMPLNGFSHFTSAMLNDSYDGSHAPSVGYSPMEMVLNHLGRFQQVEKSGSLFQRYDGDIQSGLSMLRRRQRSTSRRYALMGVLSMMQDNDLVLEVEWNKYMLHQDRIRDWISRLEIDFHQAAGIDLGSFQHLTRGHQALTIFGMSREKGCDRVKSTCQKLRIELSNVEAAYPCSPIQDSLMLSQLRQPNGVYSQHFLFRVLLSDNHGQDVDCTRLAKAWESVVAKHSILRTIFIQDESGSFLQIVLRHVDPEIQYAVLEDEEGLPEVWANESKSTGDLPLSGRVMHCLKIYTTTSGSVYCMLNKNHLITDGFSSRLLVKDFIAAYDGCIETEPVPYADYIDYVCRQDLAATKLYWETYLRAVTPCVLTWPNSRNEDAARTTGLNFEKTESTIQESKRVGLAAQKLDLTSPVIFKAAWAWLLKTYMNSEDAVYGVLSSGRDIQVHGAQRIVGPMATMLPIRAQIPPGTTAIELCRKIQKDDIEHMSHQTMSLAEIQHSNKQGDGPLFNTILNIQKSPGVAMQRGPGPLQFELLYACDTSEYDLALSIMEEDGEFRLSLEYPIHFISRRDATTLLEVFQKAVFQIISEPNLRIDKASIATRSDMAQIRKWNSQPWSDEDRLVHDVVRDTVMKQPSRPAIWSWDGQLTYSELDIESTRLAKQLLSMGCGTGSIVVLCFEKSLWAVVSMLAVAKAGAGFVHIDPKGPAERIKSIIQQTGADLGLCSAGNEPRISDLVKRTMTVDRPTMACLSSSGQQEDLSLPLGNPSSVLYIIFTSGSTGKPKGVVIQHRSFCSAAKHNRSWLQIENDSRVLQFTSYCFDASLEEIFTVLVAGGCICIPSEEERLTDIPSFVSRAQVNWAAFTPSFLRTLSPSDLPTIKFITVHAEPMSGSLVRQWADRVPMRPSYGPTECSVTSTVGAPFTPSSNAANIGWPVGCRGWVVDPNNHDVLLPVGAIGELLIDGPIVGKGYLDDPEKTAASFIAPPIWSVDPTLGLVDADPHRRLYKTGDLVRYTHDGSLVILGRKDHSQVKVRGQRVEIQEIQHYLDESPHGLHSMVIVPTSGVLRGRLVATLSLECLAAECLPPLEEGDTDRIRLVSKKLLNDKLASEVAQSLQKIQNTLSKHLPAYMMPEDWLVLEKMPVQISHKLDRQTILEWVERIDEATLQAAQELQSQHSIRIVCGNDTEEAIREIWGQVLGLPTTRVSLDTSFFRLGGDSIYAIQVMQRCKVRGLAITTQDVLANPTITRLAAIASPRQSTRSTAVSPPVASVEASGTGRDISSVDISLLTIPRESVQHVEPCSPFQERIFRAFHERRHKPYVFDTFIELTESLTEPSKLIETWSQVIERHGILRSVFVSLPGFGKTFQVILNQYHVDSAVGPVTSELDALEQSQRNLDKVRSGMFTSNSPPWSLKVYVSHDKKTFVHLIINHILIDHVSFAHILSDWRCFYQGRQSSLGSCPPSFDSYISYIYANRNLGASNQFWIDAMHGIEPCLMVPAKSNHTPKMTFAPWEMGSVKFTIEVTTELEAFCQIEGVTLSSLLQFSWALLLHLYTGNLNLVFGHLVSDRDVDIPDAEAVVGPMLSVIMGRVQLQHSPSLLISLREMQDHNIRALSHKTYDLAHVEKHLGVQSGELFDTLVNIRKVKYHRDDAQDAGAFRSISKRDPHEQRLVLAFNEGKSRLDAEITYNPNELDPQKVQMMSQRYCQILDGLSSGRFTTLGHIQSLGLG